MKKLTDYKKIRHLTDLMSGKIIPIFSSGVSKDYVDIGVETAEECRGKGYGKIAAYAMVKEIKPEETSRESG